MSEYNAYQNNNELTFNEYLSKVFITLALGLGITTLTSLIFTMFYERMAVALGGLFFYGVIGVCIAEIVIAIVMGARLQKMAKSTMWALYIVYSILTGISLSGIIGMYTAASVWIAFAVTTIMFISMAIIGQTTKVDLSRFSGLIMPGLIGLIVATLVNVFFFRSDFFQWIITYVGVVMFLFLIAYDMQMLRNYYNGSFADEEMGEKLMIMAAFQLYLDFINLFIRILRLFGKRSND